MKHAFSYEALVINIFTYKKMSCKYLKNIQISLFWGYG